MVMHKMAEILKPAEKGIAKVDIFEITDKDFGARIAGIPNGTYARLKLNGNIVMSDTPMERQTNSFFMRSCFGDVLIGGLGIGMVLMEIQGREEVKSITVVEKSQDVIDIVASQLPMNDKVTIVCDDVFTYRPTEKYDTIYMDIWEYINSDIYEREMKPLNAKYRRYLKPKKENPNRGVSCWAQYHAKGNFRLR